MTAAESGTDVTVIAETSQGDDYKLALRTRRWKYIWDRDSGVEELYDLEADPEEQHDIVDDDPETAAQFKERLRDHLESVREMNTSLPELDMDAETEERLKNLGYLD